MDERKGENGVTIESDTGAAPKFAFIGVRACELHAIAIQDRVFSQGPYPDTAYSMRRQDAFHRRGQLRRGRRHLLLRLDADRAEGRGRLRSRADRTASTTTATNFWSRSAATPARKCSRKLPQRPATDADLAAAEAVDRAHSRTDGRSSGNGRHQGAAAGQSQPSALGRCRRALPHLRQLHDGVPDLLSAPRSRTTAISTGTSAERVRKWDSCFTLDFSYIHGGSVRKTPRSRYRQWMTHKLASWIDQFGTSGCVGCGRCITWCPVGIDITEEAAAIRANPQSQTGDSMEGLERILQRASVLRRLPPELAGSSPAARATIVSRRGNICSTKASRRTSSS